jgi:hypothetical protein
MRKYPIEGHRKLNQNIEFDVQWWVMTNRDPLYRRHRFPAEVIAYAVWLYFRFPLSLRMVEDLLAARGIIVSHQTVRLWAEKFGRTFANEIRRRSSGRLGDKCWGGRPPNGIEMCQSESLTISNKGAVRGSDYPYWHGYVKARLSICMASTPPSNRSCARRCAARRWWISLRHAHRP